VPIPVAFKHSTLPTPEPIIGEFQYLNTNGTRSHHLAWTEPLTPKRARLRIEGIQALFDVELRYFENSCLYVKWRYAQGAPNRVHLAFIVTRGLANDEPPPRWSVMKEGPKKAEPPAEPRDFFDRLMEDE
jgi:hypothetical protein